MRGEKQIRTAKAGPRRRRKIDAVAANRAALRTLAEKRAKRDEAREAYLRSRDRAYAEAAVNVPRTVRADRKGHRVETRGVCCGSHSYNERAVDLTRWR